MVPKTLVVIRIVEFPVSVVGLLSREAILGTGGGGEGAGIERLRSRHELGLIVE